MLVTAMEGKRGLRQRRFPRVRSNVVAAAVLALAYVPPLYAQCTTNTQCDDGLACTNDICLSLSQTCANLDTCSNGDFCDGIESCNQTTGVCDPGTPIDCGAGEFCDEDINTCADCLFNSHCDDGNECTRDVCEADGTCTLTPLTGTDCSDGDLCTTGDVCSDGACTATVTDCQAIAPRCQIGACNASTGACQYQSQQNGTSCNDGDLCTAIDTCLNGSCVGGPANGPIDLEFRLAPGSEQVFIGDIIDVEVYAIRNGTQDPPMSTCAGNEHAISGVGISFSWDPTVLELADPAVTGLANPADPCDDPDSCVATCDGVEPASHHNWSSSVFPNDCAGNGLNAPCPGFPSNDGTAHYLAFKHLVCDGVAAPPACATLTPGMVVTTLRFRAIGVTSGVTSPTSIVLEGCIEQTKTQVIDWITTGRDDIGAIIQAPSIVVECINASDCPAGRSCESGACAITCQPPTVVVEGPRFLGVTPAAGADPVGIIVTGVDPEVSCISKYVQGNAGLGDFPFFRTPAAWANIATDPLNDPTDPTIHVRGADLISGMTYKVQLDCEPANPGVNLSSAVTVTMWNFGDVDNSGGLVNIIDATRILDGFRAQFHTIDCSDDPTTCERFGAFPSAGVAPHFTCDLEVGRCLWITPENVDIIGALGACKPERDISIIDVTIALDAFRGFSDPCAVSCP